MGGKNRKGKKISKVKRNNQTTNKLQKQGKIKNQRHHKPKPQKQPIRQQEYSDDDSEQSDDMMDMMEDDDLEYMKGNLSNGHSMKFLTSTNLEDTSNATKKKRKRRRDSDGDAENVEDQYEEDTEADKRNKKLKPLLPIKTKEGIVARSDDHQGISDAESDDGVGSLSETEQAEDSDSGDEQKAGGETQLEEQEVISAADLMVARKDELQDKKFRIGTLSSSLLESPDKKVKNFYPLLALMDETTKDGTENLISVRKLATISICEVFKDILPDYQIRHQDYSNIKLKKDTLTLYKYENELLAQYKRYLQRLEKAANMLRLKRGDNRKVELPLHKLAQISLSCLCGMLVSKPYFNYATNVCQSVIPFLNNKDAAARRIVSESCKSVFADDKKGEISLLIVRRINHLVKSRSNNVHTEALLCLLSLRIKDVNLDAEKVIEMKQKQEESHKKRLINMSKKEKKRSKKLQEVEKEMLETKAEENKMTKQTFLTEIIKTVFMIYFRILKNSPHSKLLSAVLEGLSKYTHIINLEYYSDLVNILKYLLENDIVQYKERLHCIQTVFSILSGQGDLLNIDPTKFYTYLYQSLLWVHAGKTYSNLPIVIDALNSILIKRRRKISQQILLAYVKRLATLSLQVHHNGALSCLAIIKTVAQQSKAIENLLELDESMGSGKYDSQLLEPEYCNANATSLFELARLRNHYHPTVRQFATHIAAFVPTSGEHSLPADVGKLSPEQLLKQYDGSEMAFKPAIPPPKKGQEKKKVPLVHVFAVHTFEEYCTQKLEAVTAECDFSALCKKK